MSNVIEARGLSKTYRLYHNPYGRLLERLPWNKGKSYFKPVPALQDVSFDVARGECVGLVGTNGAGKSTLLKVLTGTTFPTAGSYTVRGRVTSLLELGAGFQQSFTGRTNIYMNAAMMGFSRKEARKKVDEIIEFSELGDFIDAAMRERIDSHGNLECKRQHERGGRHSFFVIALRLAIACASWKRQLRPDEQHLFIADTGGTHQKNGPAHIRKFEVADDGKSLRGGDVLATCTNGFFDGFRLDRSGRIWTSAADGVHCLNRQGTLIGKVHIPEIVSNVCFGGAKLNRLFITGTTSLYSVFLNVNGVSR